MPTLMFAVLLCLGWLWPDHFAPWLAFHNEAQVFLALILGLGLTLWRAREEVLPIGAGIRLAALLCVTALLQWMGGLLPYRGDLALVGLYVGGAGLAWELGRRWASQPERTFITAPDTLALAFVAGATLSALIVFIQLGEQESAWMPWVMAATHSTRALGNLAQPNQLSTLLIMGVVATALLYERRRMSASLAVLLLVLTTMALVLTQSRTGMVIVLVLVVLSPWVARCSERLRTWQVWAWAAGFFLLTFLYQGLGEQASKAALGVQQVVQVGLRPLMWKQFGAALMDAPWLGYGWLQTVHAQQVGGLSVPGLEQAIYSHNQILDLAIWMGVPLLLLVLCVAILWLWRRRQEFDRAQVRWHVIWLAPLGVHAMLEFPLAYAYFLIPAAVIAGMIDRWTDPALSTRSELTAAGGRSWSWACAAMLLAYTLLATAIAVEYTQAEEDFRVARFENRNLGQTPVDYAVPDLVLLDQLGTALRAMRLSARPGMTDEELELLARASARYSWLPLHLRYAVALGLNGKPEASAQQMRVIQGFYGEKTYREVVAEFRRLQTEKYPELGRVKLP